MTGYGYKIKDNIFNHLSYMDDLELYAKNDEELEGLLKIVKSFSNDTVMEFGLDKCASLAIKRGKITFTNIDLDLATQINELDHDER